jgi:very-short-patch-repair endonuclease
VHPEFGEQQRGEANPVHRVKHLYQDPKYVAEITRGIRAHVQSKAGRSYEETYGPTQAEEYKAKLRAASPERLRKFQRRETKIEAWVRGVLERLTVDFVAQGQVGDFTVDFLIPSLGVVIQTGDYWHGNPAVYKQLSPRQRQRKGLDILADKQALMRGLSVLRLWERDIQTDPAACENRIREKIKWATRK